MQVATSMIFFISFLIISDILFKIPSEYIIPVIVTFVLRVQKEVLFYFSISKGVFNLVLLFFFGINVVMGNLKIS